MDQYIDLFKFTITETIDLMISFGGGVAKIIIILIAVLLPVIIVFFMTAVFFTMVSIILGVIFPNKPERTFYRKNDKNE